MTRLLVLLAIVMFTGCASHSGNKRRIRSGNSATKGEVTEQKPSQWDMMTMEQKLDAVEAYIEKHEKQGSKP